METPRILVIDDEKEICDLIEIYLSQEGYHVEKRYNAYTLLRDLEKFKIDLVILDMMMPCVDGLQTADQDKIEGLLKGADDYIAKPFNAMELVARVKSQLRRYQVYSKPIGVDNSIIQANDLLIDTNKKMVSVDNRPVAVTKIEYEILVLLASHPGTVFSTEDIYTKIWHEEATHANNTIMVHIRKLREKIERQPRTPRHIITVWGIGYKFEL